MGVDYLSIARTAMAAFRLGMNVSGYNVANANTPGFSRRDMKLSSLPDMEVRGGYLGSGVDVVSVSRVRDAFTDFAFRSESSRVSSDGARNDILTGFEPVMGTATKPVMNTAISNFFDSLETLVGQPDSAAVRSDVLSKARDLAGTFQRVDAAIVNTQNDANNHITSAVDRVNAIVSQLRQMNVDIVQQEAGSGEASNIRDQRDQLLDELSSLIPVRTIEQQNGQLSVFLDGTGDTLLATVSARQLTMTKDANGFSHVNVDRGGEPTDLTGILKGGEIGGLLQARDGDLANYRSMLDTLATNVINEFNAVQKAGFDQNGNAGQALFIPDPPGAHAAAAIAVNPVLAADTRLLASAGAPNEAGNNTNAQAFVALRDKMIGSGQTFAQMAGNILASVGHDVKTSEEAKTASQAIVDSLSEKRSQSSGVSLDEEAANLVKWQQAFQASARFLQMANKVIDDTLASLANG